MSGRKPGGGPTTILYVGSDPELARQVRQKLAVRGFDVDIATNGSNGLDVFDDARHDLVAVDHRLPDCNGPELLEALVARGSSTPVGIVMAEGSGERLRSILFSIDELATPGTVSFKRVGSTRGVILPAAVTEQLQGAIGAVRGGNAVDRFDFAITTGCARKWYSTRISPLRDLTGACIGVVIVTRAIAAPDEIERELALARREVDAANRTKSELIAGMSHELRTPLTAIIGYTEILRYEYFGPVNDRQKQQLDIVLDCSNHLLELIDDVLDISRIDSGSARLARRPVSLDGLITRTLAELRKTAAHHGIRIEYRAPASVDELTLSIDEKRMTQVLFNLLSNALKFTPDGGAVSVTARREEGNVAVSVSDTGLGIPAEERELIFEAFYQVRRASTSTPGGSGLGLSLTRKLVELHGGRIWAESNGEGSGSVFTFTIPTGECPQQDRDRDRD